MSEVRELYAAVMMDDQPETAEMMAPDGVTWPNMVRTLHEMRNELHAYASQLMALQLQMAVIQARLDAWEGD
jgi:hypothetical protein